MVAVWFAWWYLRPTETDTQTEGCKVTEAQAAVGVAGRAAVRRPDPAPGWWIRGSVLAGACYG
ncbi:hypothetical protein GCM10029963_64060 [Micromonospora andamanensis]|nr:hypothetical protein Vwe01_07000 [Micromonospora andamanensis]